MNIEKILESKAFWYVAIGIGAVIIIKAAGKKIGIFENKTATEKKADAEFKKKIDQIKDDQSIWTVDFWKNYPTKQLPDSYAKSYANNIDDAFGFFDDDEAKIFGTFRSIKYQTNVSQIADAYNILFKRNLHADLIDYLSENEMNELYGIVAQKPL